MAAVERRFKGRYDLMTIYLVPGFTVLLASAEGWLTTNLSVIGNQESAKLLFVVWGFATGAYFYLYTRYLFRKAGYRRQRGLSTGAGYALTAGAAVLLFASVLIPYVPERFPLKSFLHLVFAFISPVLLAIALACFLSYLRLQNRGRYQKAWNRFWILAGIAAAILFVTGFISSLLEIYVVVALCGFLRHLDRLLSARSGYHIMIGKGRQDYE